MGVRENDKRLDDIREQGGKLYSISRLNTFNTCPYQAYLKYVKQVKPGNLSVYSCLGGKIHDAIERCIKDNASKDTLMAAIEDELENLDILGIEFPKDRNGDDSIRNNWVANMTRFAEEFRTPLGEFKTEELLILPIDDKHYMMGYADAIRYNKDGTVTVIDWKSGANYSAKEVVKAGRQIVLYALALEAQGIKVKRVCWVMLKYCATTWIQKNGKPKEKVSEWRNYIKDLKSPIEKTLQEQGFDELDIELIMDKALETNQLPDQVKDKFKTKIYVRNYDITDKVIEETKEYINNTIQAFEKAGEDEANYPVCDIKGNSYFCNALCDYGGKSNLCKYYVDYCAQYEAENDEEEDLF